MVQNGKSQDRLRHEFPATVRQLLEKQVGSVCSNPGCLQPTRAASDDHERSINIGTAAHIHAASPNGPRYDENMTHEQRSAPENGIWLCRNCGTLVDDDTSGYPHEVLREWKAKAIEAAKRRITHPGLDTRAARAALPASPDGEALARDRARYDAFTKAFPSSTGVIDWLRNLNVDGFSFGREWMSRLASLIHDWSAPEQGFSNPAVQSALKTLTGATVALLEYMGLNTVPNDANPDLQHVPPEWGVGQPEQFKTTVTMIHKHADAVLAAHAELIAVARRELGV